MGNEAKSNENERDRHRTKATTNNENSLFPVVRKDTTEARSDEPFLEK